MTKPKAHTNGSGKLPSGMIELSNEAILNASEGFARLLKVRLPATLSFDLQRRFQALKFAATPVNGARDALVDRFAKKDRKGRRVAGADPGTVVLRDPDAFTAELSALLKTKQRVRVVALKRDEIPEKVDGKPVVVEGEVWELLGSLLVD